LQLQSNDFVKLTGAVLINKSGNNLNHSDSLK